MHICIVVQLWARVEDASFAAAADAGALGDLVIATDHGRPAALAREVLDGVGWGSSPGLQQ